MRAVAVLLLGLVIVGLSGVAVAVYSNSTGDFDPELHYEFHGLGAAILGFIVFAIEVVALGVVASRDRNVRVWLAGYAGVALGIVPYFALYAYFNAAICPPTYVCPPPPTVIEAIAQGVGLALTLAAPFAAVVFGIIGAVFYVRTPRTAAPSPTTPGDPRGQTTS